MKTKFQATVPSWLKDMVSGFNQMYPRGNIFRDGEDIADDEILVDLQQLKNNYFPHLLKNADRLWTRRVK